MLARTEQLGECAGERQAEYIKPPMVITIDPDQRSVRADYCHPRLDIDDSELVILQWRHIAVCVYGYILDLHSNHVAPIEAIRTSAIPGKRCTWNCRLQLHHIRRV